MWFGALPTAQAEGCILAHAVQLPERTLRKGARIDAGLVSALLAAGVTSVTVARLDEDDIGEDAAAYAVAQAVAGAHIRLEDPATGRCNLYAEVAGLLDIDADIIGAINALDPAITLATRPPNRGVEPGRMVATVKIIPFAVPKATIDRVLQLARKGIAVQPFKPLRVAVINTLLPSLKASVIEKTLRVLQDRLAPAGATMIAESRVPHHAGAVAEAIVNLPPYDLLILFGASAVLDEADVLPSAVTLAGGSVLHLGMPVDPGNLLMLADLKGKPVLGAPGCARSPQENGFDFVLERILAGRKVSSRDVVGMGVGGLLMDIVSRPAPRSGEALVEDHRRPRIAALVLAAGKSSRMGGPNKLLMPYEGEVLVHRAVRAAIEGGCAEVTVVTGHMGQEVRAAVADLAPRLIDNPDFAQGLSTSLIAGLQAISDACEAVLVLLGDMPMVDGALVAQLLSAYDPGNGEFIVVPTFGRKRGNPVLWSRRYYGELMALTGDTGARHVIAAHREAVVEVEVGEGASIDLDTPEAWAEVTGRR